MASPQIARPRPELGMAIEAAVRAGGEVMDVYARDFKVSLKADDSPVTEADEKSNETIMGVLGDTHAILSEENPDDKSRLDSSTVWIVDPLDGTADFVQRTGEFTIMVGLAELGIPVVGVIYCPVLDLLFAAQAGSGAYMRRDARGGGRSSGVGRVGDTDAWEKIRVDDVGRLSACTAVASRNHLSRRDSRLLEMLGVQKTTRVGSSLKAAWIGCGRAHLYIATTDRMKEWDSCASYCIVTEAGGKMTDVYGHDMRYNKSSVNHENGIVASNGIIHDQVIRRIKEGL